MAAVAAALSQRGLQQLANSAESIVESAVGEPTFELCFNRAFLAIGEGNFEGKLNRSMTKLSPKIFLEDGLFHRLLLLLLLSPI